MLQYAHTRMQAQKIHSQFSHSRAHACSKTGSTLLAQIVLSSVRL